MQGGFKKRILKRKITVTKANVENVLEKSHESFTIVRCG